MSCHVICMNLVHLYSTVLLNLVLQHLLSIIKTSYFSACVFHLFHPFWWWQIISQKLATHQFNKHIRDVQVLLRVYRGFFVLILSRCLIPVVYGYFGQDVSSCIYSFLFGFVMLLTQRENQVPHMDEFEHPCVCVHLGKNVHVRKTYSAYFYSCLCVSSGIYHFKNVNFWARVYTNLNKSTKQMSQNQNLITSALKLCFSS